MPYRQEQKKKLCLRLTLKERYLVAFSETRHFETILSAIKGNKYKTAKGEVSVMHS